MRNLRNSHSADVERSYAAALERLDTALTSGINPSLEGIRALCAELGDPQRAYRCVQVAGTNGKTSTVRYLAALLAGEGTRTGLYTSPHLERYPERMEVAGRVVTDARFAESVWAAVDAAERLRPGTLGAADGFTEFELLTAAALWLFARERIDVAVLEVGLGGRWDATTVVDPAVAVITGIGLDHTHILGDTIEAIAAEKAGIIAPGASVVLGPGTVAVEQVLLDAARACGAAVRAVRPFGGASPVTESHTTRFDTVARPAGLGSPTLAAIRSGDAEYGTIELAGPAYQAANLATAVAAAEAVLGRDLVVTALRATAASARVPGRFEVLDSHLPVVVDGSHNPQAAAVLAEAIEDAWPDAAHRPTVLLGVLADKDARGIVEALAPVAGGFAVTQPDSPRALEATVLAGVVEAVTGVRPEAFRSVALALEALVASACDGIVVSGSLTTAGEARSLHSSRFGIA